jgi:hypothetical protein
MMWLQEDAFNDVDEFEKLCIRKGFIERHALLFECGAEAASIFADAVDAIVRRIMLNI